MRLHESSIDGEARSEPHSPEAGAAVRVVLPQSVATALYGFLVAAIASFMALGMDEGLRAFVAEIDFGSEVEVFRAADPRPVAAPDVDPLEDYHQQTIRRLVDQHRQTAADEWRAHLAQAIYIESIRAGVDPLMVAAIVAHESSFQSQVVSHAGAVGLMQLRPWVARDLAERERIEWNGVTTLHDPNVNVRLGILYYKELMERFDGDRKRALTAYNYGPTRVSHQLREGTYRDSGYARRILSLFLRLDRARHEADAA